MNILILTFNLIPLEMCGNMARGEMKIIFVLLLLIPSRLFAPLPWEERRKYSPTYLEILEREKLRKLSPAAANLKSALEKLKSEFSSNDSQSEFLKYFPKNKRDFDAFFGFNRDDHGKSVTGELYYLSDDCIVVLKYFNPRHIRLICKIVIDIGKESSWDADAYNYLQDVIMDVAMKHTRIFREEIFKLSRQERVSLVQYLADVQFIAHDKQYSALVEKFRRLGDREFVTLLENGKKSSMENPWSIKKSSPAYTTKISSIAHTECEHFGGPRVP